MRTNGTFESRKGVASTEYIILLVAIAVVLVALVVNVGGTVNSLWAGTLDGGLEDLSAAAYDSIGSMDDSAPCPYAYDEGTGRWHDPTDGYSFVSFEDASAANCS